MNGSRSSHKNMTGRQRLPTALRQEEIVRAALGLAAKHGARGTTTQEIAAALNLTQGAVFRHFPNKDAIWLALIDWVRGQVAEMVAEVEAAHEDPLQRLQALFLSHADFVARHLAIPRLFFAELSQSDNTAIRDAIQSTMHGYETRLAAILSEAKGAGRISAGLDERTAATLFLATVQGLALRTSVLGKSHSLVDDATLLLPLLLRAIGTSPALPGSLPPGR